MKSLYPEIKPFNRFFLETEAKHRVYVEQCGNPSGLPVVFLHGGPCSGCKPDHRRFFNPEKYHIILFDQRGCGRSLPFGELGHNNTDYLIADMEAIRESLHIEKWLLFGGSWGATLALLYAQQCHNRVTGMILRGVFLARQKDLDWFIKDGAGRIFPEQWQQLMHCIPEINRNDPVAAIAEILAADDELSRLRIAKEWTLWGSQLSLGSQYQVGQSALHATQKMIKQVIMEIAYAKNHYFIEEGQILANCAVLQTLQTVIIHGRNDLVCPVESAFSLFQALPHAQYQILPNAGHIAQGKEMVDALVTATDNFAEQADGG